MIKTFIFRPLFVLTAALGFAGLFALVVILHYHGLRQHFLLYYFLPVSVPFVAFVFDRAARWRQIQWEQWAIEGANCAISFITGFCSRASGIWPRLVSGLRPSKQPFLGGAFDGDVSDAASGLPQDFCLGRPYPYRRYHLRNVGCFGCFAAYQDAPTALKYRVKFSRPTSVFIQIISVQEL